MSVRERGLVQVEVASQVLDTLVSEEVVVVSPVELLSQETPRIDLQ